MLFEGSIVNVDRSPLDLFLVSGDILPVGCEDMVIETHSSIPEAPPL
jgi:hypothetical protein